MSSYLRIRAANAANYASRKVAIVGKVTNNSNQKMTIDCEDVPSISVQFMKTPESANFKVDDVVEVRGEIVGNVVFAEDLSVYSQGFNLKLYNQALDQLATC